MELSPPINKTTEDDDAVQAPKNKTMVFTLHERKLLLKLVNLHFEVLNNKKVDNASIQLKNQAWETIHKKYSENPELVKLPRTLQQLKRCWENMKFKAKKGDPMSVKLLRWSEAQYKSLHSSNNKDQNKKDIDMNVDSFEEDFDFEVRYDDNNYELKVKPEEETQSAANQMIDNSLSKIKEALENSDCGHCTCDKIEKSTKVELLILEKQHSEELHQIKLQLVKEKLKREKELHRLHVHEMSLKIENERRRAEILERELNNHALS